MPDTVELREIPDYHYRYVYVNGQPALVDPADTAHHVRRALIVTRPNERPLPTVAAAHPLIADWPRRDQATTVMIARTRSIP